MPWITILVFILLPIARVNAQTGRLIVNVQNIDNAKGGELSTGIFIKENFPKVGKQLLASVNNVTASQMQIVFDKVPMGNYGVVSFHDVDKDKKLKSNLVGYPLEPIGFSRDAKIKFGPPDFDDAKITIEPNKTLTINIILR
jgi:uncharacterized protein (DUF2141 family)